MKTLFELAARLQSAEAAEAMLLLIVKATLILLIARLLLAAIPRASAAAKHLVATAALVAVGLMPVLSVVLPAWDVAVARQQAPRKTVGVTDQEGSTRTSTLGTAISLARVTGVVPTEPLSVMQRASTVLRETWKGLIVLAIGATSLLMLAWMIAGMIGVRHVARTAEPLARDDARSELADARARLGLPMDVRLLRSARISVPVIWGVFRPVLLLPVDAEAWPAERLRVVLLHELAHLKRFDGVSLVATRIAVSLFWFHPVAWSLERAGRSECERACDDLVLAGGTKPSEYADHLLAIARSMPSFDPFRSVTLAMSRRSQLEGRLLSILQPGTARRVFTGSRVAIACALAVAVIVPVTALRVVAQQPSEKPKMAQKSGAEITVTPHLESIEDYVFAKLGKYDKRADRFAREPRNGKEWYERAYDYYHNDRYEEAAQAFERAAHEGHDEATSLYNAACSYALLGDAGRAIPMLGRAIDAGWDDIDRIADDSDFDPIRSDPRFAQVVRDSTGEVATRRLQEATRKYETLRAGHGDEDDWYEAGLDLLRLRKTSEAIDAFQRSIAAGQKSGSAMYNIACAYALAGDVKNGMAWLDKAIENGYSGDDHMVTDPDIALLRRQPGFAALRNKAKDLQMRGCCDDDGLWGLLSMVSNWRDAAEHHRRMARKYPDSGRAWFNLGYTSLQARDYATAHEAWRRALALGYRPGTTSYNVACTFALQHDRDAAFDWLERAKTAGFDLKDRLEDDDDLHSLRRDPRWKKLVRETEEWN